MWGRSGRKSGAFTTEATPSGMQCQRHYSTDASGLLAGQLLRQPTDDIHPPDTLIIAGQWKCALAGTSLFEGCGDSS